MVLLLALVYWQLGLWLALPLALLLAACAYLFRDPSRRIPPVPLGIVAPVDGQVKVVEMRHDPYTGRDSLYIAIAMSWLDIFRVRSPMEGKVQKQWFATPQVEGAGKPAQGTREPQLYAQWIQSDEGDDVVVAVHPYTKVHLMRCYSHSGERIGQGQICGFIPFGAFCELYLPANSRLEVQTGQAVLAGSDIVAHLVH